MEEGGDGRRGDARVREPRMKGERGGLGKHADQEEAGRRPWQGRSLHRREVECSRLAVHHQDTHEHEKRPEGCHQEGLVGAQNIAGAPVETDQAPARDARDLPEDEEEDEVGRKYEPHHGAQEKSGHQVVLVLVRIVTDVVEGEEHDHGAHKGGDNRHEDGQGVSVQAERDPQRRRPAEADLPARQRVRHEHEGAHQRREHESERNEVAQTSRYPTQQGQKKSTCERDHDADEQNGCSAHTLSIGVFVGF